MSSMDDTIRVESEVYVSLDEFSLSQIKQYLELHGYEVCEESSILFDLNRLADIKRYQPELFDIEFKNFVYKRLGRTI